MAFSPICCDLRLYPFLFQQNSSQELPLPVISHSVFPFFLESTPLRLSSSPLHQSISRRDHDFHVTEASGLFSCHFAWSACSIGSSLIFELLWSLGFWNTVVFLALPILHLFSLLRIICWFPSHLLILLTLESSRDPSSDLFSICTQTLVSMSDLMAFSVIYVSSNNHQLCVTSSELSSKLQIGRPTCLPDSFDQISNKHLAFNNIHNRPPSLPKVFPILIMNVSL